MYNVKKPAVYNHKSTNVVLSWHVAEGNVRVLICDTLKTNSMSPV